MCPREQKDTDDRVSARVSEGGEWLVSLKGSWVFARPAPEAASSQPEDWGVVRRVRFLNGGLNGWDSSLIVFLV